MLPEILSKYEEVEERFKCLSTYEKLLALNRLGRIVQKDSYILLPEALYKSVVFSEKGASLKHDP